MNDLISRQAANDAMAQLQAGAYSKAEFMAIRKAWKRIKKLPPAEPEIVNCKDCRKHNKKIGFDENYNLTYKDDACPLIPWRGMSKGHEHDYQSCCFGERREVTE